MTAQQKYRQTGGIRIPEIQIQIRGKEPSLTGKAKFVVSDNSDYAVRFRFDGEWNGCGPKTVYFADGESGACIPVPLEGDVCPFPTITSWQSVLIGVQAGGLRTSRSVRIPVLPSVIRELADPAGESEEEQDRWSLLSASLLAPTAADPAMTQPVGRDSEGRLWTAPSGGGTVSVVYDDLTGELTVAGSAVSFDESTGAMTIGG